MRLDMKVVMQNLVGGQNWSGGPVLVAKPSLPRPHLATNIGPHEMCSMTYRVAWEQ